MKYNFQTMKGDTKTTSIMFDVYIALAVLPEVFEWDKVSIENEIDSIIKNIVNAPLNLKQDTLNVLAELMKYSSIHNFGVKTGSVINSEKHEFLVLSNISTSIKFIEKLYTKNNNRLNEDTINDDIESMLTSFDLKNDIKVHKPNGKALNKLANGSYGVSNAVDKLISRIYAPAQNAPAQNAPAQNAPAQNAPAQNAPAQNAPAQNAPAQNAPAQNAPAQTSVKIETSTHNENTIKIIGEAIGFFMLYNHTIYKIEIEDYNYLANKLNENFKKNSNASIDIAVNICKNNSEKYRTGLKDWGSESKGIKYKPENFIRAVATVKIKLDENLQKDDLIKEMREINSYLIVDLNSVKVKQIVEVLLVDKQKYDNDKKEKVNPTEEVHENTTEETLLSKFKNMFKF
jgi:hypothetical protein